MKVLVTGAAGCIGRATVSRLAAGGHAVRAVDRVAGVARPGVEWIAVDLSDMTGAELTELHEICVQESAVRRAARGLTEA